MLFDIGPIWVGMRRGTAEAAVQAVQFERAKAADIPQIDPAQTHGAAAADHEPCVWEHRLKHDFAFGLSARVPQDHMAASFNRGALTGEPTQCNT